MIFIFCMSLRPIVLAVVVVATVFGCLKCGNLSVVFVSASFNNNDDCCFTTWVAGPLHSSVQKPSATRRIWSPLPALDCTALFLQFLVAFWGIFLLLFFLPLVYLDLYGLCKAFREFLPFCWFFVFVFLLSCVPNSPWCIFCAVALNFWFICTCIRLSV